MSTLQRLGSLAGRVAVVTGGAGHIGRAFARSMAGEGCEVCLLDINGPAAEKFAAELSAESGTRVTSVAADIGSEPEIASAIREITRLHGKLHILVNNAAYAPITKDGITKDRQSKDGKLLEEQTVEQWDANIQVSLRGTFLMSRACLPMLRKSGHASLINIASIYGLVGPDMRLYDGSDMGNPAWYAAAKGGIAQMTRYLATTLAPAVRVNCIAPGGILRGQPEPFISRYVERTPLRRMGKEEDLCGALLYFASDLSAYVTGQVLAVDGGWTAW